MGGEPGGSTTRVDQSGAVAGRDIVTSVHIGDVFHAAAERVEWPLFVDLPPPPTLFVGRDALVEAYADELVTEGRLAIDGLPGVGKTTLATFLARHERVRECFPDGVLWAAIGPEGTPTVPLARWGHALGLDDAPGVDDRATVAAMLERRRVLLVLDNVWEGEHAEVLRCGGPGCGYLLTTRRRDIAHAFEDGTGRSAEPLPELDDEAGLELVRRLAPAVVEADEAGVRALVRSCGGLPIELELIGSYLRDAGGVVDDPVFAGLGTAAVDEMEDPEVRLRAAVRRLGQHGERVTLEEVVELSLSDRALSETARAAFYALGAFAPKPEGFTAEAAQAVTEADLQALRELVVANLVEVREGRFALHQTVSEVARGHTPTEAVSRHRSYYLDIIRRDREDWRAFDAVYGQVRRAWAQAEPEAKLEFLEELGERMYKRGYWRELMGWLEEALAIRRAVGDRAGEAATLNHIGSVYYTLGEPERALEHYEEALPIRREVRDRPGEAATIGNIGSVYDALGDGKRALEHYEEALPIARAAGDRAVEASMLNNIGGVYLSLGEPERALEHYEAVLPISRAAGDRAGEATTLNNIGSVYSNLGEPQRALEHYEAALPISRAAGDRAGEATILGNIASLSEPAKALEYYEAALAIRRAVGDRAGEAAMLNNIAQIYADDGRLEEAIVVIELVVALDREVNHPHLESDLAVLQQMKERLARGT